jgi:hypothetical protein
MKRLIPVILAAITIISCTKETSVRLEEKSPTSVTQTQDVFFITDSSGNSIPAIQFKVDFKWIDSVNAETYVKLYDINTGGWYHFSTWNILSQVQETFIPKYHTYDIHWYNYSQQGNSPSINKKMVIHSAQIIDSLSISSSQLTKIIHNVDYSANNSVLTNFTITGW